MKKFKALCASIFNVQFSIFNSEASGRGFCIFYHTAKCDIVLMQFQMIDLYYQDTWRGNIVWNGF